MLRTIQLQSLVKLMAILVLSVIGPSIGRTDTITIVSGGITANQNACVTVLGGNCSQDAANNGSYTIRGRQPRLEPPACPKRAIHSVAFRGVFLKHGYGGCRRVIQFASRYNRRDHIRQRGKYIRGPSNMRGGWKRLRCYGGWRRVSRLCSKFHSISADSLVACFQGTAECDCWLYELRQLGGRVVR